MPSRLARGLAIGACAAPPLAFAVEWALFRDLFAAGLGTLFLGVPVGLALLLAALLVRRRPTP